MKYIIAAMLAAAAAGPVSAQAVLGDAAFFRELGVINQGIQADIKASPVGAPAKEPTKADALRAVLANLKGAIPESFVRAAFNDPAVKIYPDIPGKFKPGVPSEGLPYDEYRRRLLTEDRIQKGVVFYRTNRALLSQVEQVTGVDAGILTGLLGIETTWGENTGRYEVFSALYTIGLKVPSRSTWALKELAEWLKLCYKDRLASHSVKGSYAGAFGFFQFMPSSFNRWAVDFDGDGHIDYAGWPDVLGSVGNYLKLAGWQPGGSFDKPAKNYYAIYAYNHSDNYVRAIVDLRAEILKRLSPPAVLQPNQPGAGQS
jgi:membrane-bound lytic murein transglycosylase B